MGISEADKVGSSVNRHVATAQDRSNHISAQPRQMILIAVELSLPTPWQRYGVVDALLACQNCANFPFSLITRKRMS